MRRIYTGRGALDIAEALSEPASGGSVSTWLGGVVTPALVAGYAISIFVSGSASIVGGRPLRMMQLTGTPAIYLGAAWLCAAVFLHCHFYWSHREAAYGYAEIGKGLAALGGAVGVLAALTYELAFH